MSKGVCYFFPSIVGDDGYCIKFRKYLDGAIETKILDYPELSSGNDLLLNLESIALHLAEKIKDDGFTDIYLCGYSFGGCIAFEVEKALLKIGLNIRQLFIIDAPTSEMTFELHSKYSGTQLPPRKTIKKVFIRIVFELLRYRRARMILLGLTSFVRASLRQKFIRMAGKIMREKARTKTWHPTTTDKIGIVFISSQFSAKSKQYWIQLCPNMVITDINSRHLDIIRLDCGYKIARDIKYNISRAINL